MTSQATVPARRAVAQGVLGWLYGMPVIVTALGVMYLATGATSRATALGVILAGPAFVPPLLIVTWLHTGSWGACWRFTRASMRRDD